MKLYITGWNEGLSIIPTLYKAYGYRARRPENFLRECGLWIDHRGWIAYLAVLKVYTKYTALREREKRRVTRFIIDSEVEIPVPIVESYITESFIDYILGSILRELELLTLNPEVLLRNVQIDYDYTQMYAFVYPREKIELELKYVVAKWQGKWVEALELKAEYRGSVTIEYRPWEDVRCYEI